MLEAVVECLVKRKMTTKAYMARIGMISLCVFALLATILIFGIAPTYTTIGFFFTVGCGAFTYIVFRNTDVEFEYQFFDGDLRVDKVMHKMTRKKLKTFTFGKLEIMAPEGSHRLGGGVNNRKKIDYSTQMPEDKHYVAVVYDDDNNLVELKFTPNEELLGRLSKMYPRKVYND